MECGLCCNRQSWNSLPRYDWEAKWGVANDIDRPAAFETARGRTDNQSATDLAPMRGSCGYRCGTLGVGGSLLRLYHAATSSVGHLGGGSRDPEGLQGRVSPACDRLRDHRIAAAVGATPSHSSHVSKSQSQLTAAGIVAPHRSANVSRSDVGGSCTPYLKAGSSQRDSRSPALSIRAY